MGKQQPEPDRVDDLARRLQREERIRDLERELQALDVPSLSAAEQESWWHLFGIAAFQEGRDAQALGRFGEAHRRFPQSAKIRFSLAQQHVRARDVEKAFQLFRTCRFPEISREYALAQARYAYLWGRYADGLEFLKPFFEGYRKLKILDDHFLYVRGLPFFGQWWSYLASLSILSGEMNELERVTKYAAKNCYDYDFGRLQLELLAYREDTPDVLIESLESQLGELKGGPLPSGYTAMNLAVARSRIAPGFDAAEQILDAVALTERDFGWLEDIRTLAKALAARRFDRPALEQERIAVFRAQRPMLFEPDIALNFHLLRYQEHLKPWYRGDADR